MSWSYGSLSETGKCFSPVPFPIPFPASTPRPLEICRRIKLLFESALLWAMTLSITHQSSRRRYERQWEQADDICIKSVLSTAPGCSFARRLQLIYHHIIHLVSRKKRGMRGKEEGEEAEEMRAVFGEHEREKCRDCFRRLSSIEWVKWEWLVTFIASLLKWDDKSYANSPMLLTFFHTRVICVAISIFKSIKVGLQIQWNRKMSIETFRNFRENFIKYEVF